MNATTSRWNGGWKVAMVLAMAGVALAAGVAGLEVTADQLVGTWRSSGGTGEAAFTNTFVFKKDKTYSMAIKGEMMNRSESGTFMLEKGKLGLTVKTSSVATRVGKSKTFEVKSVTGEALTLVDDREEIVLKKVK